MDPAKIRMIRSLGLEEQAQRLERGECVMCGDKVDRNQMDEAHLREFETSGICQECQDKGSW